MTSLITKKIIWYTIITISFFMCAWSFNTKEMMIKEILFISLMIAFSLMIIFTFIFEKTMHLGGYSLEPTDSKDLRFSFFVGAAICWLVSIHYLYKF